MKRLSLILLLLSLVAVQRVHAQYYSVNIDARTVAAMAAAFGTETVAESYYREQVDDILKHYTAAEVAAAGIFSSKFLERKALSELGIWSSSTENYYYRRIYNMVARKIIPKTWVVAKMMLRSPQTALYWGSYLMKVCDDTKSLCMQFESIVTNSTLTFSDVAFLEIKEEIAPLLKLSELGNIDWQRMLDDLARIPDNFTKENLQNDLDNLYNMGVGLATAGIGNIGDALLQTSSFHDLLNGKAEEIFHLYDHYSHLYEAAEQDAGRLLLDMVGGPENVAGLFDFSNYDLTSWITDYMDESAGNYYTQRWYIARREQGSVSLCDTLASIGVRAFSGCTSLSEVVISYSVEHVMENAFSNCNYISTVKYTGSEYRWGQIRFDSGNRTITDLAVEFNAEDPTSTDKDDGIFTPPHEW